MIRKFKSIIRKISGQLFIDSGDYRQSIFLAGTGRSGTTWVQEIINYNNSFRVMFEPFHSLKISLLKEWSYRQYLREDNSDDRFLKPAKIILSGDIRHRWIDQFNRKHLARKRLIKDIRANLFLKWIKQNFPEIPIILLLRHPCAVANSKLKLDWDTHLSDFLMQEELMTDVLNPFKEEIENAEDIFDKHIFMWCIENYIPLRQFNEGEILVSFYENICDNPQKATERIMSFIGGKRLPPEEFHKLSKPSSQSRKHSAIMMEANLLNSWRENITKKKIERAVEILSIFGLHQIYREDDMPLLSEEDALEIFSV